MSDPSSNRAGRIRREIIDISKRPRQVRFSEIQQIVGRLGEFIHTGSRQIRHGTLFTVGTERFSIVSHNPGDSHIKKVYVRSFLDAMAAIGWYEEEEQ
jgi:hypothetical protein